MHKDQAAQAPGDEHQRDRRAARRQSAQRLSHSALLRSISRLLSRVDEGVIGWLRVAFDQAA